LGYRPLETYESNFIHYNFAQFEKQHSRYKDISPFIVLSQQCCEVCFISRTLPKLLWNLTAKYHWNRPPPNLTRWIHPCMWVWLLFQRKLPSRR